MLKAETVNQYIVLGKCVIEETQELFAEQPHTFFSFFFFSQENIFITILWLLGSYNQRSA